MLARPLSQAETGHRLIAVPAVRMATGAAGVRFAAHLHLLEAEYFAEVMITKHISEPKRKSNQISISSVYLQYGNRKEKHKHKNSEYLSLNLGFERKE